MVNKLMSIICSGLVLSMVFVFAGCSKSQTANSTSSSSSKKIVIGFSQCTLQSPFYVSLMDAAKAEAKAKGVGFVYADAQNGVQKQNSDIQDLISKGANVLLVNPVQSTGVQPALSSAKSSNIPIIAVDRNIKGTVSSFVGRDNKKMGELAGESAVKLLGGVGKAIGTILEVQGAAGDQVMMDRRDGFHLAVDKEKGIKVIQTSYCNYERSMAVTASQDAFQAHKDIKLIYAHNDDMALGALQVATQMGYKDVKVVAIDGLMEAVKSIASNSNYKATLCNDPAYEGKMAVDTALDVLAGKTVKKYVDAKTALIDSANASTYVEANKVFAAYKGK